MSLQFLSLAAPAHHMARKAFQNSCDGAPPQNMEGEPVVFLEVPQMSLLACVGCGDEMCAQGAFGSVRD